MLSYDRTRLEKKEKKQMSEKAKNTIWIACAITILVAITLAA